MLIINVIKKIFRTIQKRQKIGKLLFLYKGWIRNGWFYCDGKNLQKNSLSNTRWSFLWEKHFIYSLKKENTTSNSGIFFSGTYKKCFYNGEKLYSFCDNEKIYYMNKNNYQLFSNICPYPFAKNYYYDDNRKLICSEYIKGKIYRDEEHLLLWAKRVLEIAKEANHEIKDGRLFYIQHGDSWFDNIIWQEDNSFVYIDLDRLGYWPALYDIIYGLTVALKVEAFPIIERELYKEIEHLFLCFGLNYSIEVLDQYYVEFLKIWEKKDAKIRGIYMKPFFELDNRFYQVHEFLSNCI